MSKISNSPQLCSVPNFELLAKDICDRYPKEVASYLVGKSLLGFFIGKIMVESNGTVNPHLMSEALKVELEKRRQT